MSKFPKLILAIVSLAVLLIIVIPANAQGVAGCKTGKFIGSYTNASLNLDIWGDGSNVAHTYVLQLNLHSDGTATQEFTGSPDIMLSGGAVTPWIGSWTCRKDGKLVVTVINTSYGTTDDAVNHPTTVFPVPPVDLFLIQNSRTTYLFEVTDDNTLTRTQARRRRYPPDGDPTDPTAGTLGPLSTASVVYKRVVASDADLLAP